IPDDSALEGLLVESMARHTSHSPTKNHRRRLSERCDKAARELDHKRASFAFKNSSRVRNLAAFVDCKQGLGKARESAQQLSPMSK
nr:hypothetical protein [Tanacetum cinerariifolium]